MSKAWKASAGTWCAALLSGCVPYAATSEHEERPPAAHAEVAEVAEIAECASAADLLVYVEQVRRLSPAGQQAHYQAARDTYLRAPGPIARLKLAALVGAPQAPFRDDAAARELLQATAQDATASAAERALAALWLREMELRAALEEERRQRQTLQQKVEQLRTIEEEIGRRPPTPVVPVR